MNFSFPEIAGKYPEDHRGVDVRKTRGFRSIAEDESLFISACSHLAQGFESQASSTLDTMVRKHPTVRDARFLLGALQICKGQWDSALVTLMPFTGDEYFVGNRILKYIPNFRLHMMVDPMFWMPILPRTEEILIALVLISRYKSDETNSYNLAKKAQSKHPVNLGLKVLLAIMELEKNRPDEAVRLLSATLSKRQDDLSVMYRFVKGLAQVQKNDQKSGFFQMETALDFTGYASEYLTQNVRYRIFEECMSRKYYKDAIKNLELMRTDQATIIPSDFNPQITIGQLREKIRTYEERGINVKLSVMDQEIKKDHGNDYLEVNEQ
jgi:hypothetical protein